MGGLAVGALALPFALVFIVGMITLAASPRPPVFRVEYLRQELSDAFEKKGNSLLPKPAYCAPPGFSLIVEDEEGRVVLSTVGAFAIGASPGLEEVAAFIKGDESVKDLFVESMRSGGRYFAWFSKGFKPKQEKASPVALFVLLGLAALAMAVGVVIATKIARSVYQLERAAGRIAAGDLESEVRVEGIREIEDLAVAMDGMRSALREDRDQRARFLASVSHDLRTPLTSIGGYLEAIDDGLATDRATYERYLGIMRDKTRLLEGRIAGLIEYAKMETDQWRMGFEPVELRSFLDSLAREFREDAALLGRDFAYDLAVLDGLRAMVDKTLLTRAFENIVSNAIRYSPEGSPVRMSAPEGSPVRMSARIAQAGASREYAIDFDDEGPGVPEAERERVFEAFVRGSSGREGEGSGLGLYIVRSVIRGHGWEIKADEAPGGGGRFTVYIRAPKA
jgi:signal transduction histidine kinase